MLTITDAAFEKIRDLIQEEGDTALKLRVFIQGGGCSGMNYGFALDQEQNEDDFTIEGNGVTVLVDAMSLQYVNGAVIDYADDIMGSSFKIENPNAETSCGCGSSFSVADDFLDYTSHD